MATGADRVPRSDPAPAADANDAVCRFCRGMFLVIAVLFFAWISFIGYAWFVSAT